MKTKVRFNIPMKQITLILITSFFFPFSPMLAMGGNSFVEQEILVLQEKAVQAIALENYPLAKRHLTRIIELSSTEFKQTRTFIDYIFLLVETEINLDEIDNLISFPNFLSTLFKNTYPVFYFI